MSPLNVPMIEKLIEAKRLEKEAFMLLLPENMQKHLEVIGNEVKAMVLECLLDANETSGKQEAAQNIAKDIAQETTQDKASATSSSKARSKSSATSKTAYSSKVKKVDIG